jgi:hypothetical protein
LSKHSNFKIIVKYAIYDNFHGLNLSLWKILYSDSIFLLHRSYFRFIPHLVSDSKSVT